MDEIQTIASLDIGSALTKVVIGRLIGNYEVEIVGLGTYPSTGVKNGSIINIETTTKCIIEAVSDAELMAGWEVDTVVVNVSGRVVSSRNEKGIIAITNKSRVIGEADIVRVIETAQNVNIPADMEILHVLARGFRVDNESNIKDPVGMTGVRLEAEVHIVTVGSSILRNIQRVLEAANLYCGDKILSSLASSEGILTQGEKDLGVAVVDIGAGICDIAVYLDGGVAYTSTLPIGSYHITSDLSIGLKTTIDSAEILKKRYGNLDPKMMDPTQKIDLPPITGRGPRSVYQQEIYDIIEPRAREILELIENDLKKSGSKESLAGGVILTGGGSLLGGIDILGEEIFGTSVTVAKPAGLTGLADKVSSPEYSTAVGLIKYAGKLYNAIDTNAGAPFHREGWASKLRRWMQDNL